MRRSIIANFATTMMVMALTDNDDPTRVPVEHGRCPDHYDDEAAAQIRAERARRKAENFAKRQPKKAAHDET